MATYTLGSFTFNGNLYNIKDTTYESLSAVQNDTSVSLVTRNEKYIWNNMIPQSQKGVAGGVAPLGDDEKIAADYLPALTNVSVTPILTTGRPIATITINNVEETLYAPQGGSGGGSSITITPDVVSGIKIATATIDGVDTNLYIPTISMTIDGTDNEQLNVSFGA